MSNVLVVEPQATIEMATTETTVGIDHVTVVPENFEPADSLRPGPAFEDADGDETDE